MKKLALLAFVVALPAAAADVTGTWNISGDVVGNAVNMKCTFTQAADAKLTGTCNGQAGTTPTTGSVAGDKATFQLTVQQYDLTFSGGLNADGTAMNGEIAVAGVTGTFSAMKEAAAPKTANTATADVAGTWQINGDVVGNVIDMKCTLSRDGVKVSGNCVYKDLGNSPTSGTLDGNKVTLQNHVVKQQPYDLTYTGTLDAAGTAMKGDIAVAGVTGTFSGTKDK